MKLITSVIVVLGTVVYAILVLVHKAHSVRLITCVIRPEQLGEVTYALKQGKLVMGMTVMNVRGFGRQRGESSKEKPSEDVLIRFLPKLKLEVLVRHRDVEKIMDVIAKAVRTGNIGDGKIVVFETVSAMRIRTGERGLSAL